MYTDNCPTSVKINLQLDLIVGCLHCVKQGNCAENTAKNCSISREEQDSYAISSYSRSKAAYDSGVLAKEIVPVSIPQKGTGC